MEIFSRKLKYYFPSLPNFISIIRLIVIPFIIWGLFVGTASGFKYACFLFIIGCLTDTLDGAVARSLGLASKLGAILDYTADKILVITTLVTLVIFEYIDDLVPILLIITRDMIVSGIREVATYQGIQIPSNFLGKLKTVLQMSAIILVFLSYIIFIPLIYGRYLLWLSAILSVISLLNYLLYFFRQFRIL